MAQVCILEYPGTNRAHDFQRAIAPIAKAEVVWHADELPDAPDLIVAPGGFSWGDYGGAGLVAAKLSPASAWLLQQEKRDTPIIGICNGFQILCHLKLLPGAVLHNVRGKFICRSVRLRVPQNISLLMRDFAPDTEYFWPVAHGEGRYVATSETHERLKDEKRIVLEYAEDLNGSLANIAGVCSENGRVIGMMPHPENANDLAHDPDGQKLGSSFLDGVQKLLGVSA